VNDQAMPSTSETVGAVRLVTPASGPDPWPAGYTMTVWGVAVGVTVVVAIAVSGWVRMSGPARALVAQAVCWRLTPRQWLLLRSASRSSGIPAAAMLVSRGAFDRGVASLATAGGGDLPVASRRSLGALAIRVHG